MAKNVIIATGFYDIPNKIPIPGENFPKVSHYYKDPHFYAHQKVVVVGASNSAVDTALEIYRKEGDVTMIIRNSEIGSRVKYWVRPDIINRIEEGDIKAFFNSSLKEVKEDEVIISSIGKTITLKNDYVLALTGDKPNFDFIPKTGLKISNNDKKLPQYNNETMETTIEGLYLAGVVCGAMETHKWHIEDSRIHASLIVRNIKLKNEFK